jgi:hypothetical protein
LVSGRPFSTAETLKRREEVKKLRGSPSALLTFLLSHFLSFSASLRLCGEKMLGTEGAYLIFSSCAKSQKRNVLKRKILVSRREHREALLVVTDFRENLSIFSRKTCQGLQCLREFFLTEFA